MRISIVAILFLFLQITTIYAQRTKGALKPNFDTNLVHKKYYDVNRGASLPSSYSLKQYAPEVMNQGTLGSCVAWASAYAGFTIVSRIEHSNTTREPYAPLDLFNRLKVSKDQDPCSDGAYPSQALEMLSTYGCAKYSEMNVSCGYESPSLEYNNKLYGYEEISVNSYNIKSALYENCPVVIAITCYENDWSLDENLEDGVWNGKYSGATDGGHAMCIIGYDDNKSGGAFLIMNSWGTNFGDKGFFWIRYSDMGNIFSAHMLKPDPNANDEENDEVVVIKPEQKFRVYNECTVTTYLAYSQYKDGAWVNEGWYAIQPDDYVTLDISTRKYDHIYWTAVNYTNNLWWTDNENGTNMCIDPHDAFTIYDNSSPSCPEVAKFYEESPGFDDEFFTKTLTCPSLSGRGNEVLLGPDISSLKMDKRSADTANFDWKSGFILFDMYSNKIITPVFDKKLNAVYTIWYIDQKNAVKQKKFTADKLMKLKAYKFISKENAERWLANNPVKTNKK